MDVQAPEKTVQDFCFIKLDKYPNTHLAHILKRCNKKIHLNPLIALESIFPDQHRGLLALLSPLGTVYFKCKEGDGYILFVILNAIHFILRIV